MAGLPGADRQVAEASRRYGNRQKMGKWKQGHRNYKNDKKKHENKTWEPHGKNKQNPMYMLH